MSSTLSTPFFNRTNQILRHKLSYEWKNIYRSLNAIDLNSSGIVTKKEFESCVHKHGVYLSRDELTRIHKRFSQNGDVNYYRVSVELGLHKPSYDYMKPHSKYVNSVSKLRSVIDGPNDTASQFGDIVKAARSERIGQHESTREAIQYALEQHKGQILKMLSSFDRDNGKILKSDFLKVLKIYGIFPTKAAIGTWRLEVC